LADMPGSFPTLPSEIIRENSYKSEDNTSLKHHHKRPDRILQNSFPIDEDFRAGNRPEYARITNQGRRSRNHVSSTLLPSGRVTFRRSLFKPILRPETENSPVSVSTGERPPKKGGQQFVSRDAGVLFGDSPPYRNPGGISPDPAVS